MAMMVHGAEMSLPVSLLQVCLVLYSCHNIQMQHLHFSLPVSVSFDPTAYTVTEGVDATAELMLVRSGDLNREVVVSVSTFDETTIGMTECGINAYLP